MTKTKKPLSMRISTFVTAIALMFSFFAFVPEGAIKANADGTVTVKYYSRRTQANGNVATESYGEQEFSAGDKFTAVEVNPVVNYHQANKWVDGNGTEYIVDETPVTEDLEVYMDLIPNKYTVSFDLSGGTGSVSDIEVTVLDYPVDIDISNIQNSGKVLKEWNTKADGTGYSIYPDSFRYKSTYYSFETLLSNTLRDNKLRDYEDGSFTVYAQWADPVTVTYDANGGTGTMEPKTIAKGSEFSIPYTDFAGPESTPTFLGWNTKADGSGDWYCNIKLAPEYNWSGYSVSNITVTDDITLYAQWGFRVLYNADTHSNVCIYYYTPELGESVGFKTGVSGYYIGTLSKAGYHYTSWIDGTGKIWKEGDKLTGALSVKPKYDPNEYTIVFDSNGGEGTMSDQLVDYEQLGDGIKIIPNAFTKKDHKFTGWNTQADGSGTPFADEQTLNTDSTSLQAITGKSLSSNGAQGTLYAQWTELGNYTVDFNTGVSSLSVTQQTVQEGGKATDPELTRTGYTLDGWYTDEALTNKFSFNTAITKDITLYAKWTAVEVGYKVVHKQQALDGSFVEFESEDFTGKTGENVTPDVKSYTGFTSPNKSTAAVKADGSLVINYNYTRNKYTLTWDANGGEFGGDYTSGEVYYGAPVTEPLKMRMGYTFDSWSIDVPKTMPAKNLTIKAVWKANTDTPYIIEHYKEDLSGGTFTLAEKEELVGTTDSVVTPTPKEYKGFTVQTPISTYTVTLGGKGGKIMYSRNKYKLTFDLDGGTAEGTYTSGTVAYGAKITAPTPVKTGYTFKGWDKTVPATMPDSDVTLKAVWEKDAAARIPGDVNDDGKVNMQDLTRLQQYLAKWEVTINKSNANVNGDNDVNMKDLTRLQQKLANWDVELV